MGNVLLVLTEPGKVILRQVGLFLVNVLLVVIILIIGWIISKVIKSIVTKVLRVVKLDELSVRIELDSILAKGGIKYSLSELMGVVCYWLALLVTFVIAINAVGLTVAAELLNKVVLYVPNIIAAIFILILGMFVATVLKNIVQTVASNAGLPEERLLAKIVQVAIMVFAVIMALEQLNIGLATLSTTLAIVLGSIGLGLALAFGLGCKDIAGKSAAEFIEKLKKK